MTTYTTEIGLLRARCHVLLICLLGLGLSQGACGNNQLDADLTADLSFVAIPNRAAGANLAADTTSAVDALGLESVGMGRGFYLAIHRRELGQQNRWFLSGFLRQSSPGGSDNGAGRWFPTRVVSFVEQRGQVFLIRSESRELARMPLESDILLDSYPIVTYEPFEKLPGAANYLLVDPAAGINQFRLLVEGENNDKPRVLDVAVKLSYLKGLKPSTTGDGLTFDQAFTGSLDANIVQELGSAYTDLTQVSGTLSVSIRRYAETTDFAPGRAVQIAAQDVYFRHVVPGSNGADQYAMKWPLTPGMQVEFIISSSLDHVQNDPRFVGYDLFQAISRGITNWNLAFGYDAFTVRKARKDEDIGQIGKNFVFVDPDLSAGAASASWHRNPNTGEVLGATVYLPAQVVQAADAMFRDDPALSIAAFSLLPRPPRRALYWDTLGSSPTSEGCKMWGPAYRPLPADLEFAGRFEPPAFPITSLSKKEKVEQYITYHILHQVGHTLGLQHNLKGSLGYNLSANSVTASVMDYLDDRDAVLATAPQAFDIAAIQYLYDISLSRPSGKFCNESGMTLDVDCVGYDRGSDPYTQVTLPQYLEQLCSYLDGTAPIPTDRVIDALLDSIRAGSSEARRIQAFRDAFHSTGCAVAVGKVDMVKVMSIPGYAARVDLIAKRLVEYLVIAPHRTGRLFNDGKLIGGSSFSSIYSEADKLISNFDKLRSVATRRMLATWMKNLQTFDAYKSLARAANELDREIRSGIADPTEAISAEDTLKYMDKLLNPYFY